MIFVSDGLHILKPHFGHFIRRVFWGRGRFSSRLGGSMNSTIDNRIEDSV